MFVLRPQEKYECALKRGSIKVVTPDWVLDCISEKTRKDEALYHPRLVVYEEEEEGEEEGAGDEEPDSPREGSTDGKSSPASSQEGSPSGEPPFSPKSRAEKSKGELMFDDSSDSSPEKQERNLNWTPAEVPQLAAAKRRLPPGKEPGLINLCANVPPVPGGILPPEVRGSLLAPGQSLQGPERPEVMAAWSPAVRTLRNITNNADIQQISRPSNVAHVSHSEAEMSTSHCSLFKCPVIFCCFRTVNTRAVFLCPRACSAVSVSTHTRVQSQTADESRDPAEWHTPHGQAFPTVATEGSPRLPAVPWCLRWSLGR